MAVRLATGGATRPAVQGTSWSGMGGTFFFVDPAQDLFAILLTQAPGQLEMLCELFPTGLRRAVNLGGHALLLRW